MNKLNYLSLVLAVAYTVSISNYIYFCQKTKVIIMFLAFFFFLEGMVFMV